MAEVEENLATPKIARVKMPEKGLFWVRSVPQAKPGEKYVVTLDYGEDECIVKEIEDFNPEIHGNRLPSYTLIRPFTDTDERIISDNKKLAASICRAFVVAAQAEYPDFHAAYSRLTLDQRRLFIRFTTNNLRPNLSKVIGKIARQFNVSIAAWQMGQRDEVSLLGGIGPCGRACCCATWQIRFPSGLTAERAREQTGATNAASLNGTCGKFKCCLAFEQKKPGTDPANEKP